jgi:hypothetical protein
MMPVPERSAVGGVEVLRPIPGVLEIAFKGHMTGTKVDAANAELLAAHREGGFRVVIFDATQITTFDASVRGPGSTLLSNTKRLGLSGIVAVKSTAVRMMATTIAFGSGLQIRLVSTGTEARQLAEAELGRR